MNTETLQSILQKVEEMNLSEGAYLEFANMMKKQYEKQPAKVIRIDDLNRVIVFHGEKQNATIRLISKTLFDGSVPIIDYEVNGVVNKCKGSAFIERMVHLFHTIRVNAFTLTAEGIVENIYYTEFYKYVIDLDKAEQEAQGIEDDEMQYNWSLTYILSQLFVEV